MVDSEGQFNAGQIGLRIKKRAKELGYTADFLAEKMNIEYATVSRIYRGFSVKIEYIYELSEILGVSTDYLLKGNESDNAKEISVSRDGYMKFLEGLSDKELEQAVMHAKISLLYSNEY